MNFTKIDDTGFLRIKLAEGTVDDNSFSFSVLVDGSGVVLEIGNDIYKLPTEAMVLELIRLRHTIDK